MSQSDILNQKDSENALTNVSDILANQLMKVSGTKQADADIAISQSNDAAAPGRVISSLDAQYAQLVGADEEVVGRAPKGTKFGTFGKTRAINDPKTGEILFISPKPEYQAAPVTAKHDDSAVVQRQYQQASNPQKVFNLNEEMKALAAKSGDEAQQASSVLLANINSEIARERDAIRLQAAHKSGLTEAEAAFNINLQLDREKGGPFLTQASHQTLQAQAVRDQALDSTRKYEVSLVESSAKLAELMSAKEWVTKVEIRGAERELRRVERNADQKARMQERYDLMSERDQQNFDRKISWAHDKRALDAVDRDYRMALKHANDLEKIGITSANADARQQSAFEARAAAIQTRSALLRKTVSEEQLTNFRIVYGTSGDDDEDRATIVNRRDKQKDLAAVISADDTTIFQMLSSSDSAIQQKAIKLVDGRDKMLNAGRTVSVTELDNLPESESSKIIKKVLSRANTPTLLLKELKQKGAITDQESGALLTESLTGDAKSKERIRQELIQRSLTFELATVVTDNLTNDVRSWKTSETASGPLKEAIDKVRSSDGKVSIDDWVTSVMESEFKNPDGSVMAKEQKVEMINSTITAAVQNNAKSSLFPANAAVTERLIARAKNEISWWTIKDLLSRSGRIPVTPFASPPSFDELRRFLPGSNQ